MLDGTGRGGVPLRSAFVQRAKSGPDGKRWGPIATFTTDARALDAYLLIHALASSKEPYTASYPAITWARAAGFDTGAQMTSAKQRWSKAIAKLTKLRLIETSRDGRQAVYTLLHESGSGDPYTRPRGIDHGGWVTVPYAYWLEGLETELSLPEKLMLLVSLDQKQRFELPTARVPEWYGISESSASRGFRGLTARGILVSDSKTTVDLQNTTNILRTVNVYSTVGQWTHANRKKVMTVPRKTKRAIAQRAKTSEPGAES